MRITFKQSLSGPDYAFAVGETVVWDRDELIRLCAAGVGEPGDDEAKAAMQESVDEEERRLKTEADSKSKIDAEAAKAAETAKKEKAVKQTPEKAIKP